MSFFKKKKQLKISLIKTVELTKSGWKTSYHTEINDLYVSNSATIQQKEAELFFEEVLKNNGAIERKEVIREEYRNV
jgi:hypothetical protein